MKEYLLEELKKMAKFEQEGGGKLFTTMEHTGRAIQKEINYFRDRFAHPNKWHSETTLNKLQAFSNKIDIHIQGATKVRDIIPFEEGYRQALVLTFIQALKTHVDEIEVSKNLIQLHLKKQEIDTTLDLDEEITRSFFHAWKIFNDPLLRSRISIASYPLIWARYCKVGLDHLYSKKLCNLMLDELFTRACTHKIHAEIKIIEKIEIDPIDHSQYKLVDLVCNINPSLKGPLDKFFFALHNLESTLDADETAGLLYYINKKIILSKEESLCIQLVIQTESLKSALLNINKRLTEFNKVFAALSPNRATIFSSLLQQDRHIYRQIAPTTVPPKLAKSYLELDVIEAAKEKAEDQLQQIEDYAKSHPHSSEAIALTLAKKHQNQCYSTNALLIAEIYQAAPQTPSSGFFARKVRRALFNAPELLPISTATIAAVLR